MHGRNTLQITWHGWSREKAEYVADYRDEAGLDYAKRLTKYELIQLKTVLRFKAAK